MTDTIASLDRGSVDNATAWCISAALATLPLMLLLPVDYDQFLPLALVPSLILAARAPSRTPRYTLGILLWSCVAFAAVGAALLSDHVARSLVTTSAWVLTVAGGFAAARTGCSPATIKTLLRGLACGGLVGLVACRGLLGADDMTLPLYGHPRILGMHMLTSAIAAVALLVLDRSCDKRTRTCYWLVAAVLSGGLWWAGGRAPILGMLVVLFHWILVCSTTDRRWLWSRLPLLGVLAGIVAWSAGSTFPGMGWLFPFERTVAATSLNELTSTRSDEIWQVSRYIAESPWFGHGADSYLFIRPRQIGDQPHNVLIQWMLDFGLLGTIPLVVILLGVIVRGSRAKDHWRRFAAGGVAGCAVVALFDGIFYHTILFIPAAVLAGLAMALPAGKRVPDVPGRRGLMFVTQTTLVLATGCLLLHVWLCRQLETALPENPNALPARVLAVFPSKTYPLVRWLEHWAKTEPATALAWSQWAIPRSISADHFHLFNARLFDRHGRPDLALAELEAARATCRLDKRPFYDELIGRFQAPAADTADANPIKESAKTTAVRDEHSPE